MEVKRQNGYTQTNNKFVPNNIKQAVVDLNYLNLIIKPLLLVKLLLTASKKRKLTYLFKTIKRKKIAIARNKKFLNN